MRLWRVKWGLWQLIYARSVDPEMRIGMMFCDNISYAATCKPEDVLANYQRNQMEYLYGDVLLRGKYPGYAFRYFDEHGLHIEFGEDDEGILKNTADFMAISYYYTRIADAESGA